MLGGLFFLSEWGRSRAMLPLRVTVIFIAKVAILIAQYAIRQASLGILRKARRIFARPALKILCLSRTAWSFAAAKPSFAPTKPLFARGILSFGGSKRSAPRLFIFAILLENLVFSADQKPRPRTADVLQLRPFPLQRLSMVKCKESRWNMHLVRWIMDLWQKKRRNVFSK